MRRWFRGFAALWLVVTAVAVAGSSDLVLDALLQRPQDARGTVVVPGRFLRTWDPLTVFFAADRGPAGGGPEDAPARFVVVDPLPEGAWTWLDARTLQFRPADPWPPLEVVTVRADGRTEALSTLLPPPSQTTPSDGQVDLAPFDTVVLSFPEPVDVDVLARMVSLDLRALPGIGDGPVTRLRSDDFEIKVLERATADRPARYAIVLPSPVPAGRRVSLRVALSLDQGTAEAVSEVTFATSEPFRPLAMGCNGQSLPVSPQGTVHPAERPLRCEGERAVDIEFTAPLGMLGPVSGRNLVRIEPSVPGLDFRVYGTSLQVVGDFQSDVPYRVSIAPTALHDHLGRALELLQESVVWVWFPRRDPYLRWGMGQGIAERSGPKRLPVEGRGTPSADLRIYKVDPKNRSLWPFPDAAVQVDEGQRPPGPGEQPPEWTAPSSMPQHELIRRLLALGSPAFSGIVPLPLPADQGAATFGLDVSSQLEAIDGKNAAGHYLVGLRRLDGTNDRYWVRLQVTDLSVTTIENPTDVVFVVSSLSTGAPIAGASVLLEGETADGTWGTLGSGTTDATGSYTFVAPGGPAPKEKMRHPRRLVVSQGSDALVLDLARPPDRFVNGTWLESHESWLEWAFRSLSERKEDARTLVHLFPDRPVFRPEDEVHLKGYARTRLKGKLEPVRGQATVVVTGPGDENWRLPVTLTELGSFDVTFKEEGVPTGAFVAQLEIGRAIYGESTFRIEAYRVPTFEVRLAGPGGLTTVPSDGPFDVSLAAAYYAGGGVAARPIAWRVTQFPYAFAPATLPGFAWASDARYGRGGAFRSSPELSAPGTTSGSGGATLSLDPGVEADARPRTYVVEATVTGADEQTVTSTLRVHAVPAFLLGLKVPRFLENATAIPLEIVAVGPDGKPVVDVETTVRLLRREWHSTLQESDFTNGQAQYVTDVVDVAAGESDITTAAAPTAATMPITEPGVYVVEVEARDRLGRVQVVRVDLYAGGAGAVAWDKAKAGTFAVSLDQPWYTPGQTAKMLIESPFQSGEALVVVETPEGNRYERVPVRGGAATFSLVIGRGWVPSLPVHVVLRKGRTDGARASEALDVGRPQTVASTVWLHVAPVENRVEVKLVHPERALPGETVDVTVSLSDPSGAPRAGEVTLWLVDRAVLALGTEQRLDPLPDFIDPVSSRVTVRDTRNLVLGRVPTAVMPGGDGGEEGDEVLDKASIRRDFRPLAFYDPRVMVPATGTKTVSVKLPDNLTVFDVRAKAISGVDRFGWAGGELAVRLPIVVQPNLPRFVRPGDSFEAAAIARVVEGDGGPGTAQIQLKGLATAASDKAVVTFDPALAARVAWPVTVPTPQLGESGELPYDGVTVTIGASRKSDGATDAFEAMLPLRDDRRERFERVVVDLAAGGSATIPALPEAARPGSVRRTVVIAEHSGLVRMAAALDVLRRSSVPATDAQLSRGRVAVGLGALRVPLGLEDDAETRRIVEETNVWLAGVVDARGLVAQWPGTNGSISLTADALAFLASAASAGHPIDPRLRATLERALRDGLRSDYPYFLSGESWAERTNALWGLSIAGTFDEAYFTELSRNAKYLVPESQARVLLAATRGGVAQGSAGVALTDRVVSEVTVELYRGAPRYAGLKSSRSDRSRFVMPSEAREVGTMLEAVLAARPEEPKVDLLVDALVRLGKDDGWGQPNADAAALLALSARLATLHGVGGSVEVREDEASSTVTLDAQNPIARSTSDGSGLATLTHTGGAPMTALVVTRWIPAADGSKQAPEQKGFVVEREWLVVQPEGPPVRTAIAQAGTALSLELGDIVEEHVRLVNPTERYHVLLTVPLGAGLEPMNPALATAPPEAKPSNRSTASPSWTSYGDDRAMFAFEQLPKGTYDLYFRTRASVAGSFVQPASIAEMVYDRTVSGLSAGARIEVRPVSASER